MSWNILFKLLECFLDCYSSWHFIFGIFSPFQLASTTFLSYLSTLPPVVALRLPLDGSSLHTVVAAVGPQLNRTAQTATGKHWIESKGEEAQTNTHHKVAECPAWPKPHPPMRSLVQDSEATGFNKSSAQPILHFPWSNLPGSPWLTRYWPKKGGDDRKSHQSRRVWEKAPESNDCGPFISNSPPGPAPWAGRSWAWVFLRTLYWGWFPGEGSPIP